MNSFSKYTDESLKAFKASEELGKYRAKLIDNMQKRACELRNRGLSDEKVIYDLITEEFPDPAQEYERIRNKLQSKGKAVRKGAAAFVKSVFFILLLTAAYLFFSFRTGLWSKSWLIMVGGILFFVIWWLGLGIKKASGKRLYPVMRIFLTASVMVSATFIFLCSQILFDISKSYLIFVAAVCIAIAADMILAAVTKQKFAIFNYLLDIPAIAALIYVILGLLGVVSWHPYWLIILNAVIIDLIIISVALVRNSKKRENEEVEDLWKEN